MCSIFGMFDLQPGDDLAALRRQALELSQRQRHRGPDWSGVFVDAGVILVHERLAIVDPASGAQPLRSRDGALALAVNGEIYNHRELRAASSYDFTTGSDCEVINALYREHGADFLPKLNGIFAFALWDVAAQRYLIARDPIGVCPLYWGHDAQGRLCVASEMKALAGVCADVSAVKFFDRTDFDKYGPDVMRRFGFGLTSEDFDAQAKAGTIPTPRTRIPASSAVRSMACDRCGSISKTSTMPFAVITSHPAPAAFDTTSSMCAGS